MDGWDGPSRVWIPAGAKDNLLPRRCHVYSGVAGVSCNRTLSFRLLDNPIGTRIHHEWAASLSACPVLGWLYHPNQPHYEPETNDLKWDDHVLFQTLFNWQSNPEHTAVRTMQLPPPWCGTPLLLGIFFKALFRTLPPLIKIFRVTQHPPPYY